MHINQVIGDIDTRFAIEGSVTFIELTEFQAILTELQRLKAWVDSEQDKVDRLEALIKEKEMLEDILAEESANEFFMEHMYDDYT
jgi:hypothetical protein